ncbi:Acg family FMN-binding oxidoreductase [Oceanibaculum indicum]|uniref:Nitroreductase family protein n=1 Tax=Oceanibaculum indicum TaxID=526216 RepID=A0A420WHP7_9PROT|nr:nitroreductase family protein [Oceanibaculum indicum]RKQ70528.1 nitroreductase family protein [Oceanibaculum indicum]
MNRRHMLIGAGGLLALGGAAGWMAMRQRQAAASYREAMQALRADLPLQPRDRDLIRHATLAANGHNTQPWLFSVAPGEIIIQPDFSRRTPVVDPDDHHLYASLGCAAENLALAAAARGRGGELVFDDHGDGRIVFAHQPTEPQESPLFAAIPHRQSTRAVYDGRPVSAADLQSLADAAAIPGIDMVLITERPQRDRVRDLVIAGNSAQMADPEFIRELKAWLRFNPGQALRTGDGLYSAASGNPALPDWLGPRAFDLVFTARAENDKYAAQLRSSAGVAVFVGQRDDREHWMRAGRACQRFALLATALGLKCAFVNQPVEVTSLRPELAALAGLPGRRPNIVLRFGYGPALPYPPRRPVEAVIRAT